MAWWTYRARARQPDAERTEPRAPEPEKEHPLRSMPSAPQLTNDEAPSRADEALPTDVRELMESRFGAELDDVRVHADEAAAEAAVRHGARAFAMGRDLYFAPGQYAPGTVEGSRLLAHELAHVVQQTKAAREGETGPGADLEAEANRAADRIAGGAALDFALSAVSPHSPALQPADWGKEVADAQKANDAKAMATLVETALTPMKKKVTLAKTASGGTIDPKDYRPVPEVNFDVHLNSKQSKPLSSGAAATAATRSLAANYGYSFTDGGKTYIILGPKALVPESPIFTRMHYEHEVYHTAHHLGSAATTAAPAPKPGSKSSPTATTRTTDDEELEAYTQDFVNYFHQLRGFGPQWLPLIEYYEKATAAAQQSALSALKGYYASPPVPATDVQAVKKSLEAWLRRRLKDGATSSKKLIQDLAKELGIASSASPGGSSAPLQPGAPGVPDGGSP